MTAQGPVLSAQHKAAREWAQKGFAVFACQPGAKEPDGSACPNGLYDATTDLAKIDAWWSERPDRNIGCAPDASGHFVLDVDVKDDWPATLAALELDHERLPETLAIRTPSGGMHYWFRGRGPSSVRRLGPALDTRGVGGYVILPGSVLADGRTYELAHNAPIVGVPEWIITLARSTRARAKAVTTDEDLPVNVERAGAYLRDLVKRGDVAIEGHGGNNRTFRLFAMLRDFGLSIDKAVELTLEIWNEACDPRWDVDELISIAEHAYAYGENEAGAKAVRDPAITFAKAARSKGATEENVSAPHVSRQSSFRLFDEREQDALTPPAWMIEGMFPKSGTAMLYGPWASYKSFIATELALSRAAGLPFYGVPGGPGMPVIYAAGEGAINLAKKRRPAWREARGILDPLPFIVADGAPQANADSIQALIDDIDARAYRPGLIILDTAMRMMAGRDLNSGQDATALIETMDTLVRVYNCLVLVIHHAGKDPSKGAFGSNLLPAGVDVLYRVEADKEALTAALFCEKMKDAEEPEPLYLKGRRVGPSLVFDQIDAAKFVSLTAPAGDLSPGEVMRALRSIHAAGADKATTKELAFAILTQRGKPSDDPEGEVRGMISRLSEGARGRLMAYAEKAGAHRTAPLIWRAPDIAEDVTND